MSYSKGPWRVVNTVIQDGNVIETEIASGSGELIAWAYEGPSVQANARLIASAPAMYEALKRAKMLGIHEEFIDAAIQQAEGGESSKS